MELLRCLLYVHVDPPPMLYISRQILRDSEALEISHQDDEEGNTVNSFFLLYEYIVNILTFIDY
jgi:hypothetical protein